MLVYVVKRVLFFIPTLLAIHVLCFFLLECAPGDPVLNQMQMRGYLDTSRGTALDYDQQYNRISKELNQDVPAFYLSIVPSYWPSDFYNQVDAKNHRIAKKLLKSSRSFILTKRVLKRTSNLGLQSKLKSLSDEEFFEKLIENGAITVDEMDKMKLSKSNLFYPKVIYHGIDNRFHQWTAYIISNQFGTSNVDGRKIGPKLSKAFKWTRLLVLMTIVFTLMISIPMAYWGVVYSGGLVDRVFSIISFSFYSIPLFWLATLMVVFFTSDDYGSWTNIFPSIGVVFGGSSSFWFSFKTLLLPSFCLAFHLMAFISRQLRSSMIEEMSKNYYLTALSKGMQRKQIIKKHVFPNAMLPIITILMGLIPAGLAGSVVIEVIFNIPGVGRAMYESIFTEDWNMLMAIVLITSFVTMVFYLMGDLIYAQINPQIKYA